MRVDRFRDLAYDILEMCMSNLKLTDEPDLSEIVEKIINHPNARVKTVAVRFVEKNLKKTPALHNVAIVSMFIECLQSDETSVGVPSINILIDLLSLPGIIDDPSVKQQLSMVLDGANEIVALRIYSVAVGVAKKDAAMLDKMQFILERCLAEMDKNDVLLLMNVLEVLKDLCLESFGFVYLENKGVFNKLMKRIETINEDPLASVLIPGLMKFFGNVAVVFPEKVFNAYPALIAILFNCLLSDDYHLLYTALDTLGYLAKFEEGKRALDALDADQCLMVLSHISKSIPNYPSDIKVRALNCYENLFWIDPAGARNNQINYICQKWFNVVFGRDLMVLLNFCHNPFEDISLNGFKCLRSLSYHDFAQRAIASTGGFVEYLLDRNAKICHEAKQLKYEIIKSLSESNAFDAAVTLQLHRYVREGFNYIQAITEVAFENA